MCSRYKRLCLFVVNESSRFRRNGIKTSHQNTHKQTHILHIYFAFGCLFLCVPSLSCRNVNAKCEVTMKINIKINIECTFLHLRRRHNTMRVQKKNANGILVLSSQLRKCHCKWRSHWLVLSCSKALRCAFQFVRRNHFRWNADSNLKLFAWTLRKCVCVSIRFVSYEFVHGIQVDSIFMVAAFFLLFVVNFTISKWQENMKLLVFDVTAADDHRSSFAFYHCMRCKLNVWRLFVSLTLEMECLLYA